MRLAIDAEPRPKKLGRQKPRAAKILAILARGPRRLRSAIDAALHPRMADPWQ